MHWTARFSYAIMVRSDSLHMVLSWEIQGRPEVLGRTYPEIVRQTILVRHPPTGGAEKPVDSGIYDHSFQSRKEATRIPSFWAGF